MAYTGEKYDPDRPLADIKKAVIADLAAAQEAGKFPNGIEFLVGAAWRGARHVDVTVVGLADSNIYHDHLPYKAYTPEAITLREQVTRIVAAYNRSNTETQTDYFEEHLWITVKLEDASDRAYRLDTERVNREKAALRKTLKGLGLTGFKVSTTGHRSGHVVAWTSLPLDEAAHLTSELNRVGLVVRTGAHTIAILTGETA